MAHYMTAKEFDALSRRRAPGSRVLRNMAGAHLIGGTICTIGELLTNLYLHAGMDLQTASGVTSVTLVFLSALLTGLKVYDKIATVGGAGTLVPITGFANAVVSPALEFKAEGFVLGVGVKMFTIAGPVIVYGTVASVIYGVIYWIITLF